MKFIFPQNYNFKSKLLGVLDYPTTIFCVIWSFVIISILNLIFSSFQLIISLSIIFILPVILFCFIGFNGENISAVVKYIIIFIIKPKVYVFNKKY